MAVEIGKHKEGKLLDVTGLPVPPTVAIDLSACQVRRQHSPGVSCVAFAQGLSEAMTHSKKR